MRVSAFSKLELSTIGTEAAGILLILIPFGPLVHILVSRREVLMRCLVFFVTTRLMRRLLIVWIMKELTVIHSKVTTSRTISTRSFILLISRNLRCLDVSFIVLLIIRLTLLFLDYWRFNTFFLSLVIVLSRRCTCQGIVTSASSESTVGTSLRIRIISDVSFIKAIILCHVFIVGVVLLYLFPIFPSLVGRSLVSIGFVVCKLALVESVMWALFFG